MKGAVLSNDEKYHGHAEVQALTIEGPYEAEVPEDAPSRRHPRRVVPWSQAPGLPWRPRSIALRSTRSALA